VRITLLTQHFAPHFEGGTEAVARAQARELVRLGHTVSVVSGTDRPHEGVDVEHEDVDGLDVSFLRRHPDESYDLALERPRLRALIAAQVKRAEIVHVHHWSTLTGSLVRELAATRPVFVTLHDLFVTCPRFFRFPLPSIEACPSRGDFEPCARCCADDAPGWSLADLRTGLEARARAYQAELDAAARVIVPSRVHAEKLLEYMDLPPERLAVIGHGRIHEPDLEDGAAAATAWNGDGPLRVLFLGHRAEVKGVLDLVQALAAVPDPEQIELIFLGDEVEPGLDERLRKAAGGLSLCFGEDYAPAELGKIFQAAGGAHLGVFPSRAFESYGLVPDELLALGLPVWVSDRGAPQERIGAAGRVLPAADPRAWTQAFCEVLEKPDILKKQKSAVPTAAGRTAADAARELEALYREDFPHK
jgi:glycosyltransferase involved in cell wall biosynthesis